MDIKLIINDKIFRQIPIFDQYYVCEDGSQIYSKYKNRFMKQMDKPGKVEYKVVQLTYNGNLTHQMVHKLVALAWVPLPEGFKYEDVVFNNRNRNLVVDHINGKKHDNRASNLRWVTSIQNSNAGNFNGKVGAPRGNQNAANRGVGKPGDDYIYYYDGKKFLRTEDVANYIGCSKSKITEAFRKNLSIVRTGELVREIRPKPPKVDTRIGRLKYIYNYNGSDYSKEDLAKKLKVAAHTIESWFYYNRKYVKTGELTRRAMHIKEEK